ncbi:hypothetical protein C2L80_09860 [Rubneribacter badeniensis]|uniref:HTH lysR-type domain-containing protein n=1 Tax=Rubneribacter badeniensis TaxID=2070688 RepID=A0A2K2U3Q6_9ACTN|nr:LysR family transcriptional regulator [Rubneribacter badeniensis]PNV64820.1 hypothetical protein C2L80_09860 [Rubneribacter badeniensis]
MDLLREFVTLSKCQSFSSAARELHLTQPVVSTHIKSMEKELGFLLVDRRRGVRLTEAGRRFLVEAQEILFAYDRAVEECRTLARESSSVRVRTTGRMPFLEKALCQIKHIPFTMVEIPVEAYAPFEDLRKGVVDICNCYAFDYDPDIVQRASAFGVRAVKVDDARLCLAMMKSNPLAGRGKLSRRDLRGATVMIPCAKWFDFAKAEVSHVLERDGSLGLKYWMNPLASPSEYRFMDLGSAVYLFARNVDDSSPYFFDRDDVLIVDELDGDPLMIDEMIAYLEDNPNSCVHEFVAALEKVD